MNLDAPRVLTGFGTLTGTNVLADASFINGSVQATGSGLAFTGYVKGTGTYTVLSRGRALTPAPWRLPGRIRRG